MVWKQQARSYFLPLSQHPVKTEQDRWVPELEYHFQNMPESLCWWHMEAGPFGGIGVERVMEIGPL